MNLYLIRHLAKADEENLKEYGFTLNPYNPHVEGSADRTLLDTYILDKVIKRMGSNSRHIMYFRNLNL